MNDDKRKVLEQRRQQLQIQRAAAEYIASNLTPFLEVLDALQQRNIEYRIVELLDVPADYVSYVESILDEAPYIGYHFNRDQLQDKGVYLLVNAFYEHFPSSNDFRYVPNVPQYADYRSLYTPNKGRDGLKSAVAALELDNQLVYFRYLRYAPVLEVQLYALLEHDHDDLFNAWHGDAVIFPTNLEWMLAFSLEEEWYGGRYNQ